jgi:hypothetical protein
MKENSVNNLASTKKVLFNKSQEKQRVESSLDKSDFSENISGIKSFSESELASEVRFLYFLFSLILPNTPHLKRR